MQLRADWHTPAVAKIFANRLAANLSQLTSGPQCLNIVDIDRDAVSVLDVVIDVDPPQRHHLVTANAVGSNGGRVLYVAPKHDNSVGGQSTFAADVLAAAIETELTSRTGFILPFRIGKTLGNSSEVVVTSLSREARGDWAVFFLRPHNLTIDFNPAVINATKVVSLYPPTGWGVDVRLSATGLRLSIASGAATQWRVAVLKA